MGSHIVRSHIFLCHRAPLKRDFTHANAEPTVSQTITTQNNNVMMKKSFYEAPEAELLLVKFEENIMSPQYGAKNQPGVVGDENEDNTYGF